MIRHPIFRPTLFVVLLALSAAPAARGQADKDAERRAVLTIRVYETATLTVDGVATKQKGGVRHFYSPPLEPGKTYYYTFAAQWMPGNNYETYKVKRKVPIQAGSKISLDMTDIKPEKGDTIEIIYVPTPPKTVEAMLKLAKVGKDDVVYDLGCGDGRIVIAAVEKFKAKRGVGVDLNEEKQLDQARKDAKKAGVEDKVDFRQGDVFAIKDISQATVVTIYMSDSLNEKLRDTLFKQLKPGTRIVSHRFLMGDWKPEKTETVDIEDDIPEEKLIHLWTVPKK